MDANCWGVQKHALMRLVNIRGGHIFPHVCAFLLAFYWCSTVGLYTTTGGGHWLITEQVECNLLEREYTESPFDC